MAGTIVRSVGLEMTLKRGEPLPSLS